PNTYFQFKQFIIHQDRCGMKLSTDAAVLGALASNEQAEKILEIGTGTGVIALMLAQRYLGALIEGVELDDDALIQAKEHAALSPWKDSDTFSPPSSQEYSAQKCCSSDLSATNPPYSPAHIKSKDQQRSRAEH